MSAMVKVFNGSKYIDWCCKYMKWEVENPKSQLDLDVVERTYFATEKRGNTILEYCPWCALSLHTLKYRRLFILEKEYGITDLCDQNIPQEFLTEEWWIKRMIQYDKGYHDLKKYFDGKQRE